MRSELLQHYIDAFGAYSLAHIVKMHLFDLAFFEMELFPSANVLPQETPLQQHLCLTEGASGSANVEKLCMFTVKSAHITSGFVCTCGCICILHMYSICMNICGALGQSELILTPQFTSY